MIQAQSKYGGNIFIIPTKLKKNLSETEGSEDNN